MVAAEQYACRLVVPASQQFGAKRWPSHRDHAAKALQKLAGPYLPPSLKQLEKAITKASADLHEIQEQNRAEGRRRAAASGEVSSASAGAGTVDETSEPVEASDERGKFDDGVAGESDDEQLVDEGPGGAVDALESDEHADSDADAGL